MNVLVMSISRKVPLLKAVRAALKRIHSTGLLYGADLNPECIGGYFVDRFWTCPPLEKLSIEQLIRYCKEHQISAIIPTRDGELLYFARYREQLEDHAIHVMVSDVETVRMSLDKARFEQELFKAGFPVIPTYLELDETAFGSFVVKERFGAASRGIGTQLTATEAIRFAKRLDEPIFQPYIEGIEYSVDLYVTRKGSVKGVIPRKRMMVVEGESQITETSRDEVIESLCIQIAESFGFYGHVLFQLILDSQRQPHIIECNCRFGGASTLAIAAGLDSFYWFMQESLGNDLEFLPYTRSSQEKRLIRYAEDLIQ